MNMLIAGIILLVIGSVIFTYCMLGLRVPRPERPPILLTSLGILLQISGLVLTLIGIVLIFIINWIWGIIALVALYFIIRLIIVPILGRLRLF